jgi:hypothetical protein
MFLAGAFMIVLGLGMTGRFPWAARLTPRPPKALMNALIKLRRKATVDADAGESKLATPVFFGLMTGLLPCGPLMAAQVSAAASGSAALGAMGMAAFAVGTAPLMIAFGTAGSMIPRAWKQRMMTVLAIGVMIFGLVFINRGLMLTGAPVNFNTLKASVLGGPVAEGGEFVEGADGVVEVPLVIENVQFVPQNLQIPADKPVRLIVERREANACSDQLMLPQLGVLVDLAPNAVTVVELPPTKAGSYTLTCGMGMMSGQLIAGTGAAAGGSPIPWLLLALAGAGAALYVTQRRAARRAQEPSKGPKGTRTGQPEPAGLLGFKPVEVLLIGTAIGLAVFAGLLLGGLFT